VHGGAHWRNLANTIESPIGNAALYEITLTNCYYYCCIINRSNRSTT